MNSPSRPGAGSRSLAPWATLCAVAAGLHALWYWPTVVDDSYITFRYALNAVTGGGLSFNPGGPVVEGSSSALWMGLSALALHSGVRDVLLAAKLAGLSLHVFTTFLVWRLAADADGRRRWPSLLAPLAWAASPFAAYHAVSGMETPLAPALLAGAMLAVLALPRHPARAAIALGGCLGLLSWSRPEAFGYAGVLLLVAVALHRREPRARGPLVAAAGIWLVAHLALLAWRWSTFHALVPNTAVAKALGPDGPSPWWRGLLYVGHFFDHQRLPADTLLAIVLLVLLARRGTRRDATLAAPVLAACVFAVAVRGDWIHSFRFMIPALPFTCALLARGAFALFPAEGTGRAPGRVATTALAVLVAAFLVQDALLSIALSRPSGLSRSWKPVAWPLAIPARVRGGFESRLAGVTRWTIESLPASERLATGDIGFPAWASEARVLDLVGLTDSTLARIVPGGDAAAFGAYVRAQDPDAIVERVAGGAPVARYDRLMVEGGALAGYVPADTVVTYGDGALAVIWRHPGWSRPSPREVVARYERARAWNPRVHDLARWEADYQRAHPGAP